MLEENDGAGNTFKATAKPVLIGTAVVGATTMIFSIIMALTNGLTKTGQTLASCTPPFLLGIISGGAVIYWFTGASMQAVTTGAYRAVEFIKKNIKLEGAAKASSPTAKKSSKSARNTRRRACSTSSSPSSSPRWPSPSSNRSSSSAT
jgi:K(+)-stimulated pyrophosphate-energized sodium pump